MQKEEKLQKISEIADKYKNGRRITQEEEFKDSGVNDYAGGNIDDAFDLGVTEGEANVALKILEILNK